MNTLLESLYHLLCFITEDARANKLGYDKLPFGVREAIHSLLDELEHYLDELELLKKENS